MLCKIADSREMEQAFAMVHEAWPHDPDPALHLQKRLQSIQHRRATWIVLREAEQIVASLGAYPVRFFGPDGERPARAIGAVFTRTDRRRQGYAAQLLNWTRQYYAAEGAQDFILFSDIGTAYYEKLGFRALSSYQFRLPVPEDAPTLAVTLRSAPPAPLDPGSMDCRFGLLRSVEDSRWLLDKQKMPISLTEVHDPSGALSNAWILVGLQNSVYHVLESNLPQTKEYWQSFRNIVLADARRLGKSEVTGYWTSPEACPDPHLQADIVQRETAILMWNSLRGQADSWADAIDRSGFRVFTSEHV